MLKRILVFLFALSAITVYAQDIEVSGRVTDNNQTPLPGVTVLIKGTTQGTTTDIDGKYTIKATKGRTLVFTFIGMQDQEFIVNNNNPINVNLVSQILEESVVIGYQTVRKADLTGAVAIFDLKTANNKVVTGTVADALLAMPGLTVRTGGAPGSEGKVEIRGTGTFGASQPLYVVDGVVSGANRDFNFNDVESVQVLKDASAAAIFGSQAANGVIIVTTKQGKEGSMKIDLSSKMTLQWLPRYNLTNRNEWITLNNMAFENGGKGPANHFDANTDWQDEVFRTGLVQDQNISLSGGGISSKYFISGNYQSNSGTTIGTKSKRLTLRVNTSSERGFMDNKLKFRIGENLALSNFSIDELNTNPIMDVFRMLPTIPVNDPNNAHLGGFGFGNPDRDITFGVNPVAREYLENTTNSNLRIRGNMFTELEFSKMFKYRLNVGIDQSVDMHTYLRKEGSWTVNQPIDPSSLNKNQARSGSMIYDNTLEFNHSFDKHVISAVVGTSFQDAFYEQIWGTKNQVLKITSTNHYFTQLDAVLTNPKTGGYRELNKMFSVFGRANYSYDDKYLFSFTIRRDESSKFNPEDRVGVFPSFSGAWRISKEDFFEVPWINDLKIRANYGSLGNSNIGSWDWTSFINSFPQAIFGVDQHLENGMIQSKLANSYLTWEKLTQANIGFDASFLSNRLSVTADYFIKNSKDVLTPMEILMVTGNSGGNPLVNAASLRNKGFELSFTWRDKIGELGYSVNLNGSYLKNEIIELGYGRKQFTQWDTKSIVGEPIGEWYLIKSDGLFRSKEEVMNHVNSEGKIIQPKAQPGDIRYIDYNDDGNITDSDRQHCGSSIPKFQLGMNIQLNYKDFDVFAQFTGAFGYKIFNGPRSSYDRFDDNSSYRKNYDPWSETNPNAKDPRPIYGDSRNSFGNQDRWLENGTFFRMSQFSVGYTLPKNILGKNISGLRVFINAQNLLTLTSYTGLDPDFLNTSIWDRSYDPGAFPNPRAITFGAQITF